MRLKRNKRFHTEVATSAMSDIMFFLLLFFLIISTLANPNVIKMDLPKSDATQKTNKQHITLSVTHDKKYFIDKDEVNYELLKEQLLQKTTAENNSTVVIRIPHDMQIQDLVDLLKLTVDSDLKFVIATEKN
jgi:biopolymer transport protein ExbD